MGTHLIPFVAPNLLDLCGASSLITNSLKSNGLLPYCEGTVVWPVLHLSY